MSEPSTAVLLLPTFGYCDAFGLAVSSFEWCTNRPTDRNIPSTYGYGPRVLKGTWFDITRHVHDKYNLIILGVYYVNYAKLSFEIYVCKGDLWWYTNRPYNTAWVWYPSPQFTELPVIYNRAMPNQNRVSFSFCQHSSQPLANPGWSIAHEHFASCKTSETQMKKKQTINLQTSTISTISATIKIPVIIQWSFLVPLIGGRWYISPQLAVYTTYIPLIYCLLLGDYISPTTY